MSSKKRVSPRHLANVYGYPKMKIILKRMGYSRDDIMKMTDYMFKEV